MERYTEKTNDGYKLHFENGRVLWLRELEVEELCITIESHSVIDGLLSTLQHYFYLTGKNKQYTKDELEIILFDTIDENGLVKTLNKICKRWLEYYGTSDGIDFSWRAEKYKFTDESVKEVK